MKKDMKDSILKVAEHLKNGTIDSDKARTLLLGLFGVSQQREQLLLFKKWEQEVYYKPYDGDAELTVDTYLKSNCG